jgi:hypothetical protein
MLIALQMYIFVIWILDRVYGLIFSVKVYILPCLLPLAWENMNFDREYESIYPVKNPYD